MTNQEIAELDVWLDTARTALATCTPDPALQRLDDQLVKLRQELRSMRAGNAITVTRSTVDSGSPFDDVPQIRAALDRAIATLLGSPVRRSAEVTKLYASLAFARSRLVPRRTGEPTQTPQTKPRPLDTLSGDIDSANWTRDVPSGRTSRARIFNCSAVAPKVTPNGWRGMLRAEHFVQVYERETTLIKSVAEYVANGLWQGERAIVIVTKEHREGLEQRLRKNGVDIASAIVTRQYIVADATETLARLLMDDVPLASLFDDVIGTLVVRSLLGGRGLRIYGEMVALLWEAGNQAGAIKLEGFWNRLAAQTPFSLFCSYPAEFFSDEAACAGLLDVCKAHSRVIPTESFVG
jgi:hypothetical protein